MQATPTAPTAEPITMHVTTPKDDSFDWHNMPVSAMAVFILAGLCLVVGMLYTYLYCTRMSPRRGAAKFGDGSDDGQRKQTTHLLLFKKS